MENPEQIKKLFDEMSRINTIFEDLDEKQLAFVSPLIQNAAYLCSYLDQIGLNELIPAFSSLMKAYSKIIKQLLEENELSELLYMAIARAAAENAQEEGEEI